MTILKSINQFFFRIDRTEKNSLIFVLCLDWRFSDQVVTNFKKLCVMLGWLMKISGSIGTICCLFSVQFNRALLIKSFT